MEALLAPASRADPRQTADPVDRPRPGRTAPRRRSLTVPRSVRRFPDCANGETTGRRGPEGWTANKPTSGPVGAADRCRTSGSHQGLHHCPGEGGRSRAAPPPTAAGLPHPQGRGRDKLLSKDLTEFRAIDPRSVCHGVDGRQAADQRSPVDIGGKSAPILPPFFGSTKAERRAPPTDNARGSPGDCCSTLAVLLCRTTRRPAVRRGDVRSYSNRATGSDLVRQQVRKLRKASCKFKDSTGPVGQLIPDSWLLLGRGALQRIVTIERRHRRSRSRPAGRVAGRWPVHHRIRAGPRRAPIQGWAAALREASAWHVDGGDRLLGDEPTASAPATHPVSTAVSRAVRSWPSWTALVLMARDEQRFRYERRWRLVAARAGHLNRRSGRGCRRPLRSGPFEKTFARRCPRREPPRGAERRAEAA